MTQSIIPNSLHMTFHSINPYTEVCQSSYAHHDDDTVDRLLQASQTGYDLWRGTEIGYRADLLRSAADQLRANAAKYARLITEEMGKSIRESMGEVMKCAKVCDYYAQNSADFLREIPLENEGSGKAYVAYEPLGAVLGIMPWNFPFWQVFRFVAPALMAGNVGLLKHAPNVQGCATAIEDLFLSAGFPQAVFQNLRISTDETEALISDRRINAVTLTGSEAAGSAVAAQAGKAIKKTVLELGGSDPFIVLEDADMDRAINMAIKARMLNCGQSCIAAKRFIVMSSVAEKFTKGFKAGLEALKIGNPQKEEMDCGPLARKDLLENLERQVNDSLAQGAQLLTGGRRLYEKGYFYAPTLLTHVKPGMPAYEEELFGPVAVLFMVETEEQALHLANDTPYGLGASIWSQDIPKAQRMAQQIESGAVFINAMVASSPAIPFGGVKRSGYGRELSYLGIKEFVNAKSIYIA